MNQNIIKIPDDITLIYCEKKKLLVISGPLTVKSLKLKLKLFISKNENCILVSRSFFSKISKNIKKKINSIQKTTVSSIKQLILETSSIFYKKLKLVGVGYRAMQENVLNKKIITLKLGYSHLLYFKIPEKLKLFFFKTTKLFIYGDSYQNVAQISALLKSYKQPDSYKGKGILYSDEKIILKEGKKV